MEWTLAQVTEALKKGEPPLLVVKNGKLAEIDLPRFEDENNPKKFVLFYYNGSGTEEISVDEALGLLNTTEVDTSLPTATIGSHGG